MLPMQVDEGLAHARRKLRQLGTQSQAKLQQDNVDALASMWNQLNRHPLFVLQLGAQWCRIKPKDACIHLQKAHVLILEAA